jgi:1-acyl-sn-glycerol-3-phosphate acyltransferase
VKEDLLDYPAFGRVLRALGAIGVGRRDPREDLRRVLEQGETALRAGRSVLVFPQATRDAVFRRREFNSLAVKLARRTGAPVAPVAVKTDFLGIGRVLRDFGPLHRGRPVMLRIGAPLAVTSGGREAHEKAVEFIAATLREWGAPVE